MELIRISDHKLKIMLTPSDMRHFEMNNIQFGEEVSDLRRSFRLLMHELRDEIGFDADDNRISVQYFPSREGGCEMFISNLEPAPADSPKCLLPRAKGTLEGLPSTLPAERFRREYAYAFSELHHLQTACRRLKERGYIGESSAFRDTGGTYYLFLSFLAASAYTMPEELHFMTEYGRLENADRLRLYIREHGHSIVSEGAVQTLAELI